MTSHFEDEGNESNRKKDLRNFYILCGVVIVIGIAMMVLCRTVFNPMRAESAEALIQDQNIVDVTQGDLAEYNDPAGRFNFRYVGEYTELQPRDILSETLLSSVPEAPTSPNDYSHAFLLQEKSALEQGDFANMETLYGLDNQINQQMTLQFREHTGGNGLLIQRYLGEDPAYEIAYIFYISDSRIEIRKQIELMDPEYVDLEQRNKIKDGSLETRLDLWRKLIEEGQGSTEALKVLNANYQTIIDTLIQT